jgi:hypothetical protein
MTTREDDDDDDDDDDVVVDDKLVYVLCVMGRFIGLCFCLSVKYFLSLSSLSYGWVQWRSYSSIIMATI